MKNLPTHWKWYLGAVLGVIGALAIFGLISARHAPIADRDPRTSPPLVKVAEVTPAGGIARVFTGSVGARVQSNLGFRVPGKVVARFVDVGQQVHAGQQLMRIDANDLRLAVTSKQNAVAAARAVVAQTEADEKRYARLTKELFAESPQRYEQAKAVYDASVAQLASAEAEARIAENEAGYSVLTADADGTVVETLGEPGQVVAAGQTVVRLAHAGPREAIVSLPETVHPALGSSAEASIYGGSEQHVTAKLRQLSNAADPQTRTYEARYILEGDAAEAPLGATVTIRLSSRKSDENVEVPVGAVFDDGTKAGVWVVDPATSIVHFRAVAIQRIGDEHVVVSGLRVGDTVVALGAHLLRDGASVRFAAKTVSAL